MNPASDIRRRGVLALAGAAVAGCATKPRPSVEAISLLGIDDAGSILRPPPDRAAQAGPAARAGSGGGGIPAVNGQEVIAGLILLPVLLVVGAVSTLVVRPFVESGRGPTSGSRSDLWRAYELLRIDFASELQSRLLVALKAADTPLVLRADHAEAPEPRPVPGSWLDLSVRDAGYYADRGAGGFTPWLVVRLRLKGRGDWDDDLLTLRYAADYRAESPSDRRFFSTPPAMNLPRLEDLPDRLEVARAGFAQVMDRMVACMTLDVLQRMRGAEVT